MQPTSCEKPEEFKKIFKPVLIDIYIYGTNQYRPESGVTTINSDCSREAVPGIPPTCTIAPLWRMSFDAQVKLYLFIEQVSYIQSHLCVAVS